MLDLSAIPIDPLGNFVPVADVVHGVVHAKRMHSFAVNSVDNSFDIAAPIKIVIQTGAKEVHWESFLEVFGGRVLIEMYIGSTVTGGTGTTVTAYNHHAGTASNLGCTVLANPTVTANGTKCAPDRYAFGTATGSNKTNSTMRTSAEWMLAANSVYTFILTTNTDNTWASFILDLYERYALKTIIPWAD